MARTNAPEPPETKPALPVEAAAPPSVAAPEPPPSTLPAGVTHHHANAPPGRATIATEGPRDPKAPPEGWVGSFWRCGGCGDFLGNTQACPGCGPAVVPSNVSMSGLPVAVAR